MSDNNNININTPEIGPYTQLKPFRFWCQKVLPLVYDESLSYYELLCKVVDYLNKTMEDVDQMITDMGDFQTADRDFKTDMVDRFIAFSRQVTQTVDNMQLFIANYFDNLNVQEEINNKLDAMAEAGYFDSLFTTLFTDDIISEARSVTSAWIEENLSQETGYVLDESLTVNGAAADSKAVGDAINVLRGELNPLLEDISFTLIEDSYWITSSVNEGIPAAYNGWSRTKRLPCISGEMLHITTTVASQNNLFFSADQNRQVVSDFALTVGENYIYVPDGATYFALSNTTTGMNNTTIKRILSASEVQGLIDDIKPIQEVITCPNNANPEEYTIGYYYPTTGEPAANATYDYTGRIPVKPGETLYLTTPGRFLKALDSEKSNISSAGVSSDFTTYPVPENVYYVYITFYHENINEFAVNKIANIPYVPYGTPYFIRSYLPELDTMQASILQNTGRISVLEETVGTIKPGFFRVSGDLNANDYLLIDKMLSVQKNVVITFTGNFTGTFGGLEIGFTTDITQPDEEHFIVTDTDIERVTSSPTASLHGLTVADQITVTLESTIDNKLNISVESGGEKYTSVNGWRTSSRKPYIKSLGTMTDCIFTWTCKDCNCRIALFGDSYLSYSEERWRYYLNENGYSDNTFVNAYGGENSANGLINFNNLISIINPKYVLWGYGMNDQDAGGTYNAAWKSALDNFLDYCDNHGIIPILATIPNVPTRDNSAKNTYIRNSGRRYIDFAKAVGSDNNSTWYTGMLSTDNVHPSEYGAMALYYRAMVDFPELAIRD